MSVKRNILIVDDEKTQTMVFQRYVKKMGHNELIMHSGSEVINFFTEKKPINNISPYDIDVMLLDMSMPDVSGIEVLEKINPIKGDLQIIVLTASQDVSLAVNAMNLGAIDYIVKGEKDLLARITASINNAIAKRNLKYQISNLERKDKDCVVFSDIIGKSKQITDAINLSKKIINSTVPVLIEGESGAGKELLAMAIHGSSIRSGKLFVKVDCEELTNENAESILFGYENVLDNGIIEKSIGKIREANGGTLFLHNIHALKKNLQVKLLRCIQEGEVEQSNNKSSVKINIRVISATNQNLQELVEEGIVREDLYYRLAVFPIRIPNLLERGAEDIKLLSENFIHNFAVSENKKIKSISKDAMELLTSYEWEDNVRQLKNYMFRGVILCDDDVMGVEHFPQIVNSAILGKKNKKLFKKNKKLMYIVNIFDEKGNYRSLEDIEEEIIKKVSDLNSGNLSEVSKKLQIGRSTIYRRLKLNKEDYE